nr:hypothetical protein [Proteiniphilum sp. UBA5375]
MIHRLAGDKGGGGSAGLALLCHHGDLCQPEGALLHLKGDLQMLSGTKGKSGIDRFHPQKFDLQVDTPRRETIEEKLTFVVGGGG